MQVSARSAPAAEALYSVLPAGGKTSAYGAGISSENFEIGSPNVRSTIDSGHWEKLKLFVFPSSFSINLHQLSFHKEICKTRNET
jgi:hypothetical protein